MFGFQRPFTNAYKSSGCKSLFILCNRCRSAPGKYMLRFVFGEIILFNFFEEFWFWCFLEKCSATNFSFNWYKLPVIISCYLQKITVVLKFIVSMGVRSNLSGLLRKIFCSDSGIMTKVASFLCHTYCACIQAYSIYCFRRWFEHPTADREVLMKRQKAISFFLQVLAYLLLALSCCMIIRLFFSCQFFCLLNLRLVGFPVIFCNSHRKKSRLR